MLFHFTLQGARLLEDIVRWGTEALFSPEALAAAQPAADAAPEQQPAAAVKAEGGGNAAGGSDAAPMQEDGVQPDAAAAAADATANKDADAAAAPEPASPLSEPALQQLVAIADEVRKSAAWRLPALPAPSSSSDLAPDSATNGPISGAAAAPPGGGEAPKTVTGLGAGLEAAAARDWQPNECEEAETSEAGVLARTTFVH